MAESPHDAANDWLDRPERQPLVPEKTKPSLTDAQTQAAHDYLDVATVPGTDPDAINEQIKADSDFQGMFDTEEAVQDNSEQGKWDTWFNGLSNPLYSELLIWRLERQTGVNAPIPPELAHLNATDVAMMSRSIDSILVWFEGTPQEKMAFLKRSSTQAKESAFPGLAG